MYVFYILSFKLSAPTQSPTDIFTTPTVPTTTVPTTEATTEPTTTEATTTPMPTESTIPPLPTGAGGGYIFINTLKLEIYLYSSQKVFNFIQQ